MKNIVVPVILAGGIGERFWPFSRSTCPKQLLPIISNKPMIVETIDRVKPYCKGAVKPLVVTGASMAAMIKKVLPKSYACDYIVEPVGKNTAPAVAIAAAFIEKKYGPDAVMVVLSADHSISTSKQFLLALDCAVETAARQDGLVVFGIPPSRPDTGYGYISMGKPLGETEGCRVYEVKKFVEKPSAAKAAKYVEAGTYAWNSGMFVWKVSVILAEFEKSMPALFAQVQTAARAKFTKAAIDAFYMDCAKESVDYGIMENAEGVFMVQAPFFWDDIGAWESLERVHPLNKKKTVSVGKNVYERDCENAIVANNGPQLLACIGVKDVVVVSTGDAVLVIAKDKLPEFKKYLSEMKGMKGISKKLF